MTSETQIARWARAIRRAMPESQNLEHAAKLARADFEDLVGESLNEDQEADFHAAVAEVRKEYAEVEILRVGSIVRRRPAWFHGVKVSDKHWPALLQYIKNIKEWDKETIDDMAQSSEEVISLLGNPAQPKFSCRGLVIGYVQSGKTANMTAVIARAVDAGYNTIIVLAGLTDKLRQQTQNRIKEDIIDRRPLDWMSLTSGNIDGDFVLQANGGFAVPTEGNAQIAVVKKNVAPLKKLAITFQSTIPAAMNRLRVLIIDDECDQATVNSASKELEITAINAWIRTILAQLPAVSYVGYTATPFANVLINPYASDTINLAESPLGTPTLDDLYPSDFITSLPKPSAYFGTEKLFGRPATNAELEDPDTDGLDMIRTVPESDEQALQPASAKERNEFQPTMPSTLVDAILYFISCCAVRRARGDTAKHSTMLIHTSTYVVLHNRLGALIRGWLDKNKDELLDQKSLLSARLEDVWNNEQNRLPSTITTAKNIPWSIILNFIPKVINDIKVPIENGSSEDRIDYKGRAKTYIVVGGSILARGLTLEGLVVSYFLRSSTRQYDTLLQMGRWFGFRINYEDLPRIWMPNALRLSFKSLAAIEAEVRADIEEYRMTGRGPMEFAVRVRALPGMAITAASKMRSAVRCDLSYTGKHVQTIRFNHTDPALVNDNWQAAADLVSLAQSLGDVNLADDKKLYYNIPKSAVIQFLKSFRFHETHRDLSAEMLLNYIGSEKSGLKKWNIGIFETTTDKNSELPLGTVGHVKLVKRTKLKNSPNFADIKGLMSLSDILFDCQPRPQITKADDWSSLKRARSLIHKDTPLLLIYAIDKDSTPLPPKKPGQSTREELSASGDLIGVGIVFPGSEEKSGPFVSVELQGISADQIDEIELEEFEQAEAAGVNKY